MKKADESFFDDKKKELIFVNIQAYVSSLKG